MDAHAQVVSFNGLLASQAATDALPLVTGFAPPDRDDYIRKFDGVKGSTKSSESERSVEARLRHSMDEYKGRRVRVHGLVQRGIEARTGIPTIDVWQPTQIEVLR